MSFHSVQTGGGQGNDGKCRPETASGGHPSSSSLAFGASLMQPPGKELGQPSSVPSSTFHNPYLGHRNLTLSEAHLLGEYYRLSQTLKRIIAISSTLSDTKPHAQVLEALRLTERKMGLVITLFKASVWSIMMEQDEKERAREEARRLLEEEKNKEFRHGRDHCMQGNDDGYEDDETLTYQQH